MKVAVEQAETDAQLADCLSIRKEVFVEEQSVDADLELDGLDNAAMHLLALVDGIPAGTLRIRFPEGMAKIERVAVLRQYRSRGIGAALSRAALDRIRETSGINRAILGSQVSVIGFYEKLGFKTYGPEFDDAGIPHRMMELEL